MLKDSQPGCLRLLLAVVMQVSNAFCVNGGLFGVAQK